MNRFVRTRVIALTILVFVVPVHDSLAQALDCGADDQECLENSYVLACGAAASRESPERCIGWVQRVQEHALAHNPQWKLIAGLGYARIAGFGSSQEDAEYYSERSRAVLYEILNTWPETWYVAQAYIVLSSLATVAGDIDGSISYMQSAMRADPDDAYIPWSLARKLQRRSSREAADMYRIAYSMNEQFWYLAVNALQNYEWIGDLEEAERFRAEVAADSGMIDFADEVVSAGFAQDLERAAEVLGTACHSYIVPIFGPDTCASGIDTLVDATRTDSSLPEREAIVEVAVEAMRRLMATHSVTEDQRRQFRREFGIILREWRDSGVLTSPARLE